MLTIMIVKLAAIWLAVDLLIVATVWYLATVIKPRFPHWWKREVIDDEPRTIR